MRSFPQLVKRWLLPPGFTDLLHDARGELEYYLELSGHDRHLLKQTSCLKDRHVGRRCFVLGAGGSVNSQNLKKLQGEFVISVSNTFVHPDIAVIRPRYHVTPAILQGHGGIYELDSFISWLHEMEAATDYAEMIFHVGDRSWIESNGLFKDRQIHWVRYTSVSDYTSSPIDLGKVPYIRSVSEMAITLAVYLGFDQIYLLGIDHDWFNGALVYFYDHKTQHAVRPDIKNFDWVDSEFQMRRHAEIFKKYKYLQSIKHNIYNANADPKHYLDVFPKVDYEALFTDNVKKTLPQEP